MKCPLLLPLIYQLGGLPDGTEDDCKQEECAWWDGGNKQCAILVLAVILSGLDTTWQEILTKMPHADQFTK